MNRDYLFLNCEIEHDWQIVSSRNCCCGEDGCSIPVMECSVCKICDYGENDEAAEIKAKCEETRK